MTRLLYASGEAQDCLMSGVLGTTATPGEASPGRLTCACPRGLVLTQLLEQRLGLRRRPVLGARVLGVHVVLGPPVVVAVAQRTIADVVPTRWLVVHRQTPITLTHVGAPSRAIIYGCHPAESTDV